MFKKRSLAALGLILGGGGIFRRRQQMTVVAPELRSRALLIPMSIRNNASLKIIRSLPNPAGPVAEGVQVRVEVLPATDDNSALRLLVYEPRLRTRPSGALLWIHGGGLIIGTPEMGNELCSHFASELGIVVISVDYRLAPEHPFPAGLYDCFQALTWLHDQADALGIDATRVAVGGDSAGGGLAACLAQMAQDRGGPAICFQLLQYPMLDDRTSRDSQPQTFVWSGASNRFAWQSYLGHPLTQEETRPYAAAARRHDLTGLPPAWIGVGTIDLFHAEDLDYATRLRAAGVSCDLHEVPGMYHAADHLAAKAPAMQAFRQAMVTALSVISPAAASAE